MIQWCEVILIVSWLELETDKKILARHCHRSLWVTDSGENRLCVLQQTIFAASSEHRPLILTLSMIIWFSGTCQKMDWWGKNARSPPRRLRRYWKGNPFAIEIGQWPRPSRYHVMTFQSARLNVVIQELSTYYGFSPADPKSLAFQFRGPIDFYVVAIIPDICQ